MDVTNRSYFYATVDGWGNRSFFTYFSEFQRPWNGAGVLEAFILSVIFVTSVVANVAIIYAVLKHRPLQTVTNYFIANLAVTDLLFTVNIPLVAIIRLTETWVLGDTICRLILYFQCVCGAVLVWSLALISVDRYRCIMVPPMRMRLTARHALYLILIVWAAFFALFIPVAVWFQVLEFPFGSSTVQICTLVFPFNPYLRVSVVFIVVVLVFACFIPTVLLVFNYHCIFRKLLEKQKEWSSHSRHSVVDGALPNPRSASESQNTTLKPSFVFYDKDYGSAKDMPRNGLFVPKENDSSQSGMSRPSSFWKIGLGVGGNGEGGEVTHSSGCSVEDARNKRHYKTIKILVLNVLVVLLMWLPLMIMICVIYVDSSNDGTHFVHSYQFVYCLFVAFANTCANPILYGVLNDNFRRCFAVTWGRFWKHCQQGSDASSTPSGDQCPLPSNIFKNRKSNNTSFEMLNSGSFVATRPISNVKSEGNVKVSM